MPDKENAEENKRLTNVKTLPQIRYIALEGGGQKGIAHGGAWKEFVRQLKKSGGSVDDIDGVAGSSAGGLMALLISVGYSPDEIIQILDDLEFQKLVANYTPNLFILFIRFLFDHLFGTSWRDKGELLEAELERLIADQFIYRTIEREIKEEEEKTNQYATNKHQHLENHYQELTQNPTNDPQKEEEFKKFLHKIGKDTKDAKRVEELKNNTHIKKRWMIDKYLRIPNNKIKYDEYKKINFTEVFDLSKKDKNIKPLYLMATKIKIIKGQCQYAVLSHEETPKLTLAKAALISAGHPGLFQYIDYEGITYSDGAIAKSFPIDIFNNEKYLKEGQQLLPSGANPHVVGLSLGTDIPSWFSKIKKAAFNVFFGNHCHNVLEKQLATDHARQTITTRSLIDPLAFDTPKETKLKLIEKGKRQVSAFFNQKDAYSEHSCTTFTEKYIACNKKTLNLYCKEINALLEKFEKEPSSQYIDALNNEKQHILNKFYSEYTEEQLTEKIIKNQNKLDALVEDTPETTERRKKIMIRQDYIHAKQNRCTAAGA